VERRHLARRNDVVDARRAGTDDTSRAPPPPPEYTIRTFEQTLDHFNVETATSGTTGTVAGTFEQRYLLADR
jgi:hypothetical protein